MGKATGRAVHELLGGAVRDSVSYFGFRKGDDPEEIVVQDGEMAEAGHDVIYVKVGRGNSIDIEIAKQVRLGNWPGKAPSC